MVYQHLKNVQNYLFAGNCELCNARIHAGNDFCAECKHSLPWMTSPGCRCCAARLAAAEAGILCGQCQHHRPFYTRVTAAFEYCEPVVRLIVDLKYHQRLHLARVLGGFLADAVVASNRRMPDVIVPVPLHASRLRSRGYNQALEIAKPVGKRLALPVDPFMAERIRQTESQTDLPRKVREKNVRGAFAIKRDPAGQRIALVDDVMTTGHTVNAVARALLEAKAESVEVWAVARA